MPPTIALLLTISFIGLSFWVDRKKNPGVSPALWLPFLWLFFIGTRFPSQWIELGPQSPNATDYQEGSPIDQIVYFSILFSGLATLLARKTEISRYISLNASIALFLGYCLASVMWSDYPWTALKRFIKVLEHVVMVLVVLTDRNPQQAIDSLFRRFLAPAVTLSVLFIKYYPEIGRGFSLWTGQAFNTGATLDKNALGHICAVGLVFLVSTYASPLHRAIGNKIRTARYVDLTLLASMVWLLHLADAKTALACAMIGVGVVLLFARANASSQIPKILVIGLLLSVLGFLLEYSFGLSEMIISALGRDPTLTDRVYVWADVLASDFNPVLGTGFESFWLGSRLDLLWQKYWWRPNQAHNGYIETYVNLGVIGLVLLIAMVIASLRRALALVQARQPLGSLKLALLIVIPVFNYTDATFKALHILYFTFFLMSMAGYSGQVEITRRLRETRHVGAGVRWS